MRRLILVSLVVLFVCPIVTPAISPTVDVAVGNVAQAYAINTKPMDEMTFFDWLVLWFQFYSGNWPE
jgi:hypothetical protein